MARNATTETRWEDLPLILTVREVAGALNIGTAVAYSLCHRRDFPALRIGRVIRVPRESLRRWLDKETASGESQRQAP